MDIVFLAVMLCLPPVFPGDYYMQLNGNTSECHMTWHGPLLIVTNFDGELRDWHGEGRIRSDGRVEIQWIPRDDQEQPYYALYNYDRLRGNFYGWIGLPGEDPNISHIFSFRRE